MRIQTAIMCQKDDFIHSFVYAKMKQQITPIKTKTNAQSAGRSPYFYLCSSKKNKGRFAKCILVCQKHSLKNV